MIQALILAMAMTGQCSVNSGCSGYYTQPQYGQVYQITEYWTNGVPHHTKFYANLYYGEDLRQVPVINGWVPRVTVRNQNGVRYVIYDYRDHTSYESCLQYSQKKHSQLEVKTQPQAPKEELTPQKTEVQQVPTPAVAPKKELEVKTPAPEAELKPIPDPHNGMMTPLVEPGDVQKAAASEEPKDTSALPKAPVLEVLPLPQPMPTTGPQTSLEQKPSEVADPDPVRLIEPSYKGK